MLLNNATEIVLRILEIYNDLFGEIIFMFLLYLAILTLHLSKSKNSVEDNKWNSYCVVFKNEILQMIVQFSIFIFLIFMIKESFNIDIINLFQVDKYCKIWVSLWIGLHFKSGVSFYNRLQFHDFLDKVKDGKYSYMKSETIYLNYIENYQANYEVEIEKISILKSIAPVSMVPLLAGFVFEGKTINVNWNWFTVIFFLILFMYLYKLWKSFKYLKIWKWKKIQMQNELRRLQDIKE